MVLLWSSSVDSYTKKRKKISEEHVCVFPILFDLSEAFLADVAFPRLAVGVVRQLVFEERRVFGEASAAVRVIARVRLLARMGALVVLHIH